MAQAGWKKFNDQFDPRQARFRLAGAALAFLIVASILGVGGVGVAVTQKKAPPAAPAATKAAPAAPAFDPNQYRTMADCLNAGARAGLKPGPQLGAACKGRGA